MNSILLQDRKFSWKDYNNLTLDIMIILGEFFLKVKFYLILPKSKSNIE